MKILDFLFYYYVNFYDKIDSKNKKFSSHTDQASYVLTMCFLIWLIEFDLCLEYLLFKTYVSIIPVLIMVTLGMIMYFYFRKIYIIKGKYNLLKKNSELIYNVTNKTGRIIVVVFPFFSLMLLFITAIIIHSLK